MSSRKRRKRPSELTIPEELFGVVWARRLRIGVPSVALASLLAGCLVFVMWSQTIGRLMVAMTLVLGVAWFTLRRGDPEGALDSLRRRRVQLVVLGSALVAAGFAVYATVDQDLGLLLVVLGGAALVVTVIEVKQQPLASPMDGPMYGDTPPIGGDGGAA